MLVLKQFDTRHWKCAVLLSILNSGCGSFQDEEKKPEILARFESNLEGEAQLTGAFSDVDECAVDPETGIAQIDFHSGEQKLSVAIRDLAPGESEINCVQSASNFEDRRYIGDGFEGCAVEIQTVSETYGLYRNTTALGLFAASTGCTLNSNRTGNLVAASFTCPSLVQTAVNRIPRNPVADQNLTPRSTRPFTGTFRCNMESRKPRNELAVSPLPPIVAEGSLILPSATNAVAYRSTKSCNIDAESGTLKVEFNKDDEALNIEIRDFERNARTYDCAQTENNSNSSTELGDLYNGCALRMTHRPQRNAKLNGYAMYRHDVTVRPFRQQKSCSIQILKVDTFIKGQIKCSNMAQTILNGLPRNPVASKDLIPDLSADLKLAFECALND